MVKGKIWGTVCGKYHEIEIEECDVIVAIGMKAPDEDGAIGTQATSLGYGLTMGILLHRWLEVRPRWF